MTPESELRARVERGATFLDQAEPRWWKRIEHELEMSHCCRCVLGQMYGAYARGVRAVFGIPFGESIAGRLQWSLDHGFFSFRDAEYKSLDRLWLEAIEARRADPDRYVP